MIVVLGHGSRIPEHNLGLKHVVEMLRDKTELSIEPAYMENCTPDLGSVIRKAAAEGYVKFIVAPLFLFKGVHVGEDVPQEIATIKEELPGIEVTFAKHLGADPLIAEVLWQRVREVI